MCGQQFVETMGLANGGDAFLLAANTAANAGATSANCEIPAIAGQTCLQTAADTCSFIQIPGGSLNPITATSDGDVFCGTFLSQTNGANPAIANQNAPSAITTTPFTLRHASLGNTNAVAQVGFSLDVTQLSQC